MIVRVGEVRLCRSDIGHCDDSIAVAGHLARTKRVRLALLAREQLPPENEWDSVLAKNLSSRVAGRIAKVRELRADFAAPVEAPAEMRRASHPQRVVSLRLRAAVISQRIASACARSGRTSTGTW